MALELIRDILLWCSVINIVLLAFFFLIMCVVRQKIYALHSKWFPMTEQQFNLSMYLMMGGYKILVFVFNIVPYIAIRIITA